MALHNDRHDFPLTATKDRGWYKWIDGASRYICSSKLSADEAARYWYQNEKAIRARFRPKVIVRDSELSLRDLVNKYLTVRKAETIAGNITPEHFSKIRSVSAALLKSIGPDPLVSTLRPDNFAPFVDTLRRYSPRQQRVRARIAMTLFTHAEEEEWIERAPKFGRRIKESANRVIIDERKPVYSADECRKILAAIESKATHYRASRPDLSTGYDQLRLLALLALNGGYGMRELGKLRVRHFKPATGMIDSIRTKKQTEHRVPLWPETLAALTPFVKGKKPNDAIFKTRKGHELTRSRLKGMKAVSIDGPGQTFVDLLTAIGLKHEGHGFYLLKHTHRSVSGGAGDESAADILVGHRLPGMRAVYQNVDDARLRKVADYVRTWLFTPPAVPPQNPPTSPVQAA